MPLQLTLILTTANAAWQLDVVTGKVLQHAVYRAAACELLED
jgi:hypothetical protein